MHRIFALPEMVATILYANRESMSFQYSCLLVNRLFSQEASRFLWSCCGLGFNRTAATVRHLSYITKTERKRGQYYAAFIQDLRIFIEGDWPQNNTNESWLAELTSLHFPKLKSLTFDGAIRRKKHIDQYLQNDPKTVRLLMSEGLFDALLDHCPRIESLNFEIDQAISGCSTDTELIEFIEAMPTMSSLSIASGFETIWSPYITQSLAKHPSLRALKVPILSIDSRLSIDHMYKSQQLFPKLEKLDTSTFSTSLETLTPYLSHLRSLDIVLLDPTLYILKPISHFSNLTSLCIEFATESSISSTDLIRLAASCPKLVILEIPFGWIQMAGNDTSPTGIDINDETIEQLALLLPNIDTLSLAFTPLCLLSYKSLISIGRHCKNLGYCCISGNFAIDQLVQSYDGILFPSLIIINLFLDEENPHEYTEIESLVKRFADMAPKLDEVNIYDGSESDNTFSKLFDLHRWPY